MSNTCYVRMESNRLFYVAPLIQVLDHRHPVGLLWTSDQLVAEAATYTAHNKRKGRISVPSEGFKPAIPAIKRFQTYALDRTATGIGILRYTNQKQKSYNNSNNTDNRNTAHVECKNKGDTSNNWGGWNYFKSFRKYVSNISGKHEVKELQKTALLGTAHICRKVLM